MNIETYIEKYNLNSAEKIKTYIEQLKRNTLPNKELINKLEDKYYSSFISELFNNYQDLFKKQEECKTDYDLLAERYINKIMAHYTTNLQLRNNITTTLGGGVQKDNEYLKNIYEMDEKTVFNKSKCSPQCFCDGSCKIKKEDNNKERFGWQIKRDKPVEYNHTTPQTGKKETEGKLKYEISWRFIEEMAKRMQNNKGDKYLPYNWKKPINVEDLKQAINRHHVEVMEGNYKDGDEELGHIVSYACNAMMLWWQLKNNLK